MKTKNLILGLIAFVFAVGTAVASTFMTTFAAYVHVDPAGAQTLDCYSASLNCNDNGTQNCSIRVFDVSEDEYVTVQGYKSGCSVTLKSGSATPQTSTLQID